MMEILKKRTTKTIQIHIHAHVAFNSDQISFCHFIYDDPGKDHAWNSYPGLLEVLKARKLNLGANVCIYIYIYMRRLKSILVKNACNQCFLACISGFVPIIFTITRIVWLNMWNVVLLIFGMLNDHFHKQPKIMHVPLCLVSMACCVI